ncbi:spore protease YyaC [Clostridium sp.]|uniref:spore protease YyaC n=1 Tax=Clostridium sp. TaxID=1506 RepID=UPI003464157E
MNKVKSNYKDTMGFYNIAFFIKDFIDNDSIIVCIGTDRCIGDCLGPLVGTLLKDKYFPLPVYGTIDSPIHALNIDKKLNEIKALHPTSKVVGIDACLGDTSSIGEIQARDYPIHPGKGVGKTLPNVGDISIVGIVDSSENPEIFTSRSIRLSLILDMSTVIVNALFHALYMNRTHS